MEGVMMRGPKVTAAAVRNPQGEIVVKEEPTTFISRKYPIFKIPLLRGVAGFIESMAVGYRMLMYSAEISTTEEQKEEEMSKVDLWMEKHLGDKAMKVIGAVGMVLGLCLAIGLFFWLPTVLFNLIPNVASGGHPLAAWRSVFEGVFRILIFLLYMVLISQMKDIRRLFQYHGAEHKTIFCYENRQELTVENVRAKSRFHPRCGTSFLILILLIGILLGFFIQTPSPWLRTLIKILLLPLVMGIGYELIKLCGKYDNIVTRIIAAPGLWMQRLTTKEPDDSMMEVAIAAMKKVIPEDGEDIIR